MKPNRASYFATHMDVLQQRDRIFLRNPVFLSGLGLAPIVAAASTLQKAAVLGLAMLLILIPTRVISALIARKTVFRMRGAVYTLTASVLYIAVYFLMRRLFGTNLLQLVGIYLPLLVMEPLVIKRYEQPTNEKVSTAFFKGVLTTMGFELALFLVAGVREFLALGTLFGHSFMAPEHALAPVAGLVCGGFLVVGVLSALWRTLISRFKKSVYQEVNENAAR